MAYLTETYVTNSLTLHDLEINAHYSTPITPPCNYEYNFPVLKSQCKTLPLIQSPNLFERSEVVTDLFLLCSVFVCVLDPS